MRLDDYDPNAIDVVDQRGSGRSIAGRGGQIGCGTIVIALIAALVFGVDPGQMLGGADLTQQGGTDRGPIAQGGSTTDESCRLNEFSMESCNVLSSLNKTWEPLFRQAQIPFRRPALNFYSQMGQSGCGAAQSAMGPFYCPSDQGIYIDTDFYTEMEKRMNAGGDFARAYVMAHEYGHHIQMLTGVAEQIRSAQQQRPGQANALQVRMELQADCYAGVWASLNRDKIEAGDMEEGLNAAHSIGDDTLMRQAGRRPVEEAFTHGSSEQRMEALRRGLQAGSDEVCDQYMR
jgi:predicted metalloprotease